MMIIFGFYPEKKITFREQLDNCFAQLHAQLSALGCSNGCVLKQSIFINAADNDDYTDKKAYATAAIDKYFLGAIPPVSILGQPPSNGVDVAMEVILALPSDDYKVHYKIYDDVTYALVESESATELYAAGMTGDDLHTDTRAIAQMAFKKMLGILTREGMSLGDIVYQWNYIENIIQCSGSDQVQQNYQLFNDVRSMHYANANFRNSYPAATGIGMHTGGVILDCIAVRETTDVAIVPLTNSRQVDAYQYSPKVLVGTPAQGFAHCTTPKFERGKYVAVNGFERMYVSGTAAIVGENSTSPTSIEEQAVVTIENMYNVITADSLKINGIANDRTARFTYVRGYVKCPDDVTVVQQICKKYFGDISILLLISDVCRVNLLVELEGVAEF